MKNVQDMMNEEERELEGLKGFEVSSAPAAIQTKDLKTIGKKEYRVLVPSFANAKTLKSLGWRSLLFYHLLRAQSHNEKRKGMYINLHAAFLQKQYGNRYRKHILSLLRENWIEMNGRYKNAKNGFSKSYRLSDKCFCVPHKEHFISLQSRVWEKFKGSAALGSDYLNLIKVRHDTLSLGYSPSSRDGMRLKKRLDEKSSKIKQGKTARIYSPIIQAPKKYRKDVVFGSRGNLVNVDISGMIQQILNREIKDSRWNKWIENDFATCLRKELGLGTNRNTTKVAFLVAISKKEYKIGPKKKIRVFLREKFPAIMAYVDQLNVNGTVQAKTQRIEADLVKAFILENKMLTMIPAHDGVFCGEKDAWVVKAALESFLQANGMVGCTKIKPEIGARPLTLADILAWNADVESEKVA
jgi:hypothetical protein